jgi:choline dehydrogenase-like flavoprotein
MGPKSDPMAVVDHHLRVHEISGLRVADKSALPRLTTGHPQHPTYAIGEKCAFIVAEDAGAVPRLDL